MHFFPPLFLLPSLLFLYPVLFLSVCPQIPLLLLFSKCAALVSIYLSASLLVVSSYRPSAPSHAPAHRLLFVRLSLYHCSIGHASSFGSFHPLPFPQPEPNPSLFPSSLKATTKYLRGRSHQSHAHLDGKVSFESGRVHAFEPLLAGAKGLAKEWHGKQIEV